MTPTRTMRRAARAATAVPWVMVSLFGALPSSLGDGVEGGLKEPAPFFRYNGSAAPPGAHPDASYGTQGFAATKLDPLPVDVSNSRTQRVTAFIKEWVALKGYHPDLLDPEPKLSAGRLEKVEVQGTGRCLDGSWPVYFFAYGTDPTKWVIELEGGDWCTRFWGGATDEEQDKDERRNCFERMDMTGLQGGTTKADPVFLDVDYLGKSAAYFSDDSDRNPLMHSWNKVYVRNCDGSSFTSSRLEPWDGKEAMPSEMTDDDDDNDGSGGRKVYMQGRFILDSVLEDLLEDKHLGHATEVAITGCSAGGLAVSLHADKIASRIRGKAEDLQRFDAGSIKIRALADSGFFLDEDCGKNDYDYNARMKFVYEHHQARPGLNPRCLDEYESDEGYRCMFAENALRFLDTPVFVSQSILDGWAVVWVGCGEEDKFAGKMKDRLAEAVAIPGNGGFMDACQHHCHCHEAIEIGGYSQVQAFKHWYEGGPSRIWFSQDCNVEFKYPECPEKSG